MSTYSMSPSREERMTKLEKLAPHREKAFEDLRKLKKDRINATTVALKKPRK